VPNLSMPLEIDFRHGDDLRIYTPPYAHRKINKGFLEFGSLTHFGHSWASIGSERFSNFRLEFTAAPTHPELPVWWIGVNMRSQHYFANYGHLVLLRNDGAVFVTQPDESSPNSYRDEPLRPPTLMGHTKEHAFRIAFSDDELQIAIDEWETRWDFTNRKTFGPGLVRFQSSLTRMRVRNIRLTALDDRPS